MVFDGDFKGWGLVVLLAGLKSEGAAAIFATALVIVNVVFNLAAERFLNKLFDRIIPTKG